MLAVFLRDGFGLCLPVNGRCALTLGACGAALEGETRVGSGQIDMTGAVSVGRSPWWSLAAISALTCLVWIAASAVTIALPAIARDLSGSMDALQWAVNGFLLAGSLIVVGGRLADVFGRRLMLLSGAGLLAAGSVVSAVAPDVFILVLGRVVQGVGAALVLPAALATVVVSFSGRERQKAIGLWIAACWGSQALGPVVGGAVLQWGSWRALFWVLVPLVLLSGAWILRVTPESKVPGLSRRIDVPGAVLGVGAVALLSYALVSFNDVDLPVFAGMIALVVVLLVVFVLVERKVASPLVVLSIFSIRRFNGATSANLLVNLVFGAVLFVMALYLQVVQEYGPLEAGLLLLPATVPILLVNPLGARLHARFGPAVPTGVGMGLLAVGVGGLMLLDGSYLSVVIPFLLIGSGVGLQITACADAAVEDTGSAGEGVASGLFKAASMVGGSLGVALTTAVFQVSATSGVQDAVPDLGGDDAREVLDVIDGAIPVDALASLLGDRAQDVVRQVFDTAAVSSLIPSAVAALLGVAVALLLRGGPFARSGVSREEDERAAQERGSTNTP